jgi:hypothetical protein
MRHRRVYLAAPLSLALVGPVLAGPDAASLLFETPALIGVPTGTTLIYRMERTVAGSEGVRSGAEPALLPSMSMVELSLKSDSETGGRDAHVEIVTAERLQAAGSFQSLVGNPVVVVFLERDVADMSRILRGSPYYIRNRIREALGETTLAEPARFTFEGREIEGWRVAVSPFAQDRNRDKLREYSAKRYEYAVPGGVYELRTSKPGGDGAPLIEDRLVFERSQPTRGNAR